MDDLLEHLKPRGFFKWFEEISRIPHGSGHEAQLAAFLEKFAAERNLPCRRDAWDNVLIRVPATAGYEQEPSILLQGHLDMVWAKNSEATIDLAKDPLDLWVDGNCLRARGTTLGADDGVAIATMLALADDDTVAHPALELFCTSQEESGLIGVRKADLSVIRSRRMINLDSGSSHEICVSAVGAKMVSFEKNFPAEEQAGLTQLHIDLFGGLGGHAGTAAHKNRACCINIMGELLYMLRRRMPVYLAQIVADGPALHGACAVHASVPEQRVDEAVQLLQAQFLDIRGRYRTSDPDLALNVSAQAEGKPVLSAEDSANIIRLMFLLHTGVRKSHPENLNIIMTSITFSRISLKDGAFYGAYHIRSMENSVRDMWYYRTEEWLRLLGFTAEVRHEFAGWPGSTNVVMQERFAQEHRRLFGREIKISHVHASIEVNVIFGQMPDMDAVAIHPTAVNFHTTDEALYIDQVQPFWDLLLAVLARKDP